ncbi:MAG: hypothetical protein IBX56_05320 [Methylomicrobium sp.]|nr:hypothetical protein [Methylomicrobium sp.]
MLALGAMAMHRIRITLNITLALGLFAGGIYLVGQESFFLRDRWDPNTGTLFHDVALYCLAFGLMFLGSFAGMVGYSWAKGTLPMPSQERIRPHPAYKGMVITRFWYLLLPAICLILLAFLLADKGPNKLLHADKLLAALLIYR